MSAGFADPSAASFLLALVSESSVRTTAFLGDRFRERFGDFGGTVAFLSDLGCLKAHDQSLEISSEAGRRVAEAPAEQRLSVLASTVFHAPGTLRGSLARYLVRFDEEGGELIYRPDMGERLRDAPVRDFLMQLGVVAFDIEGNRYHLRYEHRHLALWARNHLSSTSLEQLLEREESNRALGHAAELEVLAWEKERVGQKWSGSVTHVSHANAGSCFDIESVTLTGPIPTPRFIEVKAVPAGTLRFHWSSAEVGAARVLRERYFLYLLPVVAPNGFDVSRMEVIQDPFATVYQSPDAWAKVEADIICERRNL